MATSDRARLLAALLLGGVTLALTACGPEESREAGGLGADHGNRPAEVQLQGDDPYDDRIYYETPHRLPAEET
ncbi:MAG: hypothetical protein H0W59_10080 [Chloroflexia bacterium]|nr:hypothetical protein [Chloroflexia bacterium]